MNVELAIEQLILHDLPTGQRRRIAAAIEQELARLFAERGVPPGLAARGSAIPIDAADVAVAPGLRPDAIGTRVAESIYSTLANTQPVGKPGRSEP